MSNFCFLCRDVGILLFYVQVYALPPVMWEFCFFMCISMHCLLCRALGIVPQPCPSRQGTSLLLCGRLCKQERMWPWSQFSRPVALSRCELNLEESCKDVYTACGSFPEGRGAKVPTFNDIHFIAVAHSSLTANLLHDESRMSFAIGSYSVETFRKMHAYIGLARTIHIRYLWQANHQIHIHIRCIFTVLANPRYMHVCLSTILSKQFYLPCYLLHPGRMAEHHCQQRCSWAVSVCS